MALLELEHVEKVRTYPDGRQMVVLRDIDLAVAAGRVTVLIGPSGSGKTTLLRLVNRLEDPTGGRILLNGRDIARLDPLQLRRKVMLVPQKPFMFDGTVLANLQRPFTLRKEAPPGPAASLWRQSLARVDLPDAFLERRAATLSIGQQQRVGLARALLCRPEVVLLDEPTSALDRPASDRFAGLLRGLCRADGLALLLVTHDLWFAERIADEVAFLDDGWIVERGPADRIFPEPQTGALRRFLFAGEKP